jgi:hypothetical protein
VVTTEQRKNWIDSSKNRVIVDTIPYEDSYKKCMCRVLSQKIKHNKKAHFQQCAGLTEEAAELAARLILKKRPELIALANDGYLAKRQSKIKGAILRLFHIFLH